MTVRLLLVCLPLTLVACECTVTTKGEGSFEGDLIPEEDASVPDEEHADDDSTPSGRGSVKTVDASVDPGAGSDVAMVIEEEDAATSAIVDASMELDDEDAGEEEPTLLTTEVSLSVHCCTYPPNETNLISEVLTATVTDEVEFPTVEDRNRPGYYVSPVDIDMSQAAIDLVYTGTVMVPDAEFNGYRFDFSGDAFTRITDAVLGPENTVPEATVTFDADSVFVNVEGLRPQPGMRISVLLTLE